MNLINFNYLSRLMGAAIEANDRQLVKSLYQNLEYEYDTFVREWRQGICDGVRQNELLSKIHSLKNKFSNLGAETVAKHLEYMYHEVKLNNRFDQDLKVHYLRFTNDAEVTFSRLSRFVR